MSEIDPAEQITEALSRIRWRGGHMPMGGHAARSGHGAAGHSHEHHSMSHGGARRGSGGPALKRLLATLALTQEPLSVTDIAELVGVDQPRASRLVAQGVEFGLLRREADPSDARRTRIALTEQGEMMAQRIRSTRSEAIQQALIGFSDDERQQLASLLGRLAEAWPDAHRERR